MTTWRSAIISTVQFGELLLAEIVLVHNSLCTTSGGLHGQGTLDELVVMQGLSRAGAAMQLQSMGNVVSPGQFMRFVLIRGKERVRAWELGIDPRKVLKPKEEMPHDYK